MTLLLTIGVLIAGLVVLQLLGLSSSSAWCVPQSTGWRDSAGRGRQLEDRIETIERSHSFATTAWKGWVSLRVVRVEQVSEDCRTFVFADPDGAPMPSFLPGQFLMVRDSDDSAASSRCYSLSDAPSPSSLQITVKRVANGKVSNWLHENVSVGDLVSVRAPGGRFVLDIGRNDLAVGIAAGVGITPIASMAAYIVKMQPGRPIVIFYSARDGAHSPLLRELRILEQQCDFMTLVVLHSRPNSGDTYDLKGRLTIDVIRQVIGRPVGSYYLCGPMSFMAELSDSLKQWGVPSDSVSFESFGGGSEPTAGHVSTGPAQLQIPIKFKASEKDAVFSQSTTSLLDVAESAGVQIDADCRAGACGTCLTKLIKGTVRYDMAPSYGPLKDDECLACVAKPDKPLEVDA